MNPFRQASLFYEKWDVYIQNIIIFCVVPAIGIAVVLYLEMAPAVIIAFWLPGEIIMLATFKGLRNHKESLVLRAIYGMFFYMVPLFIGFIAFFAFFLKHVVANPHEPIVLFYLGAVIYLTGMLVAISLHIYQIVVYMVRQERQSQRASFGNQEESNEETNV